MSKKVKIFGIVIAIIIVLLIIFTYVGNNNATTPATTPSSPAMATASDTTTGLSSSAGTQAVVPGGGGAVTSAMSNDTFTALLSSINSISLDTSIFSNPAYKALRDYPIMLGTAIIGRQNPFAPIGTDTGSSQAATSVSVQTLTPSKVLSTSAELGALATTQSTAPTTVVFQYGTSDALGSATSPVNVTKSGTALFTVTGLTAGTSYYVQAVAVQGSTTATGTLMTFTTAGTQAH